jgi:DNA adenine methylase
LQIEHRRLSSADSRLKPPLKWAGGKRWLVPRLETIWRSHQHRRFVEPFCGGLGMVLGLNPASALLNDVNPHLINFYRWLQRGLTIGFPMANTAQRYYALRARFNALRAAGDGESAEAAGIFYYLNRTGYNGLCRFNSRGEFNVPFGRYKNLVYRRRFPEYVEALARFEFSSLDFEALPLRGDDFIYADPPYDVDFRQYSKGGFDWDEQRRAAEWLGNHSGPVVLSNQATDRILVLYKQLGYDVIPLSGPRMISCTGDRTPASEVLATRNLTAASVEIGAG